MILPGVPIVPLGPQPGSGLGRHQPACGLDRPGRGLASGAGGDRDARTRIRARFWGGRRRTVRRCRQGPIVSDTAVPRPAGRNHRLPLGRASGDRRDHRLPARRPRPHARGDAPAFAGYGLTPLNIVFADRSGQYRPIPGRDPAGAQPLRRGRPRARRGDPETEWTASSTPRTSRGRSTRPRAWSPPPTTGRATPTSRSASCSASNSRLRRLHRAARPPRAVVGLEICRRCRRTPARRTRRSSPVARRSAEAVGGARRRAGERLAAGTATTPAAPPGRSRSSSCSTTWCRGRRTMATRPACATRSANGARSGPTSCATSRRWHRRAAGGPREARPRRGGELPAFRDLGRHAPAEDRPLPRAGAGDRRRVRARRPAAGRLAADADEDRARPGPTSTTPRLGSMARHVSDLSDPDANWFVLLGGQDGWFGAENFADQVRSGGSAATSTCRCAPQPWRRRSPTRWS